MTKIKEDITDYDIKLKEYGKPIFKCKGKKKKVIKEINIFFKNKN